MSLIHHVHPLEGTDREEALVDLLLPPLERHFAGDRASDRERRLSFDSQLQGSQRSIRRVISYDALKPPEDTAVDDHGGLTPYHVSTAKRVGKLAAFGHIGPFHG